MSQSREEVERVLQDHLVRTHGHEHEAVKGLALADLHALHVDEHEADRLLAL